MHPILELMMEYRLKHSEIVAQPKKRPLGPSTPARPAKPPRPPRKPKTVKLAKPPREPKPISIRRSKLIKRVPSRDRPKTRQIQKNLMKIAKRAEEYKKSLLNVNENRKIDEGR